MEWLSRLHVRAVAWLALLGVFIAFGAVPVLFPGFERADEAARQVATVTNQLSAITTRQDRAEAKDNYHQAIDDSKSILQLKAQECMLPKDSPRNVYSQTIVDLAQECIALAAASNRPVKCDIPACGDL